MASILKVDTLQKPDGSTPTAADLGIDVAGSVVQVVHSANGVPSGAAVNSTTFSSIGVSASITPKYDNSHFFVTFNCAVSLGYDEGFGVILDRNGSTVRQWGNPSEYSGAWEFTNSMTGTHRKHLTLDYLDTSAASAGTLLTYNVMINSYVSKTIDLLDLQDSITVYEIAQ